MTIKEMREMLGLTQSAFAKKYNIPFRTIQNWESGDRKPPEYILQLLEEKVLNENFKPIANYYLNKNATIELPKKDQFFGAISWLKAVKEFINADIVFAMDEALMCQGLFNGHMVEDYIYVYGDKSLTKYKGVIVLKNNLNENDVTTINGIKFTNLNRTIYDYFINESIVDNQGLIEELSKYYYKNNESFKGIFIPPFFNNKFNNISLQAKEYYNEDDTYNKINTLPKREDFVSGIEWLQAVKNTINEDIIFALDNALICQNLFLGRYNESIIWVYSSDDLKKYNSVVVIGNSVNPNQIIEQYGLKFTNFNRTLIDSIDNEKILDMQGITEALSAYYYTHHNSVNDLFIPAKNQKRFDELLEDAIEYYNELLKNTK